MNGDFHSPTLDIGRATQNAAVAYALLGSSLSLILGVTAGITGAALGTLLFDISGGLLLPLARTARPLSEEAGTRLAANIVLCLCVAIGIVVVACQTSRVTANKA